MNGLPNWRSAVYYYRHVRKLGLAEACVILTFIISLGQYLVGWASYLEKKYTFVSIVVTLHLFYWCNDFTEKLQNSRERWLKEEIY